MLDHIGFAVSDLARSRAFYDRALATLGVSALVEVTPEQGSGAAHVGYGDGDRPWFWISGSTSSTGRLHVCLTAVSRPVVDAFHIAALEAGGRDNGAPGVRAHYHPHYYGAFVLDPDGHNIEAVCHAPETST